MVLTAFGIQILNAQTCLTLSSASVPWGGTASLELSLQASADLRPASVQWTLRYSSSAIRSLTVDDGPATTGAGKTVMCAPNAAGSTCMAVARNTNTIANGVIAKITAVLAPDASNATIEVIAPWAASPEGYFIPITARSGLITTASVSADRQLRPPLKRTLRARCPSNTE